MSVDLNLSPDHGDPQRLSALAATPELLDLLGVQPVAGRAFTAEEDRPGRPRVVLISDTLREQLYGRSWTAMGSTIRLNGIPAEIVGVVAPGFGFGVVQLAGRDGLVDAPRDGDDRRRSRAHLPAGPAGRGAFVERLDDVIFGRTRTALTVLAPAGGARRGQISIF